MIHTIWHYGIRFFDNPSDAKDFSFSVHGLIYSGGISELDYHTASGVAQIHPKAIEYYELAGMPLFQGKGKLRSGTENPVMAISSYRTKRESNMDYVVIWRMFDSKDGR